MRFASGVPFAFHAGGIVVISSGSNDYARRERACGRRGARQVVPWRTLGGCEWSQRGRDLRQVVAPAAIASELRVDPDGACEKATKQGVRVAKQRLNQSVWRLSATDGIVGAVLLVFVAALAVFPVRNNDIW